MPKWLMIIVGILLICVVSAVAGGWYIKNKIDDAVSGPVQEEIAASVSDSVGQAIAFQSLNRESLVLTPSDINANSVNCEPLEIGFEVAGDVASICGVETSLDTNGLTLSFMGMVYQGTPAVYQRRVELDDSTFDKGLFGLVLSGDAFEDGFEIGLNDALEQAGLKPVAVSMESTTMVIETEPLDQEA